MENYSNGILVFDWDVLESCMSRISNYYSFLDGLRRLSNERGELVLIVSERSRAEMENKLGFLLVSNIALFLNGGRDVRINSVWIQPYQRLDNTVQIIRQEMGKHEREFGGEIAE